MNFSKKLFSFSLLILLSISFLGCSTATQQETKPATSSNSGVTINGQELYDAYCASCHGAAGVGARAGVLNTGKNVQDVINVIKSGINPVMPGYQDRLSSDQIKAMASYVAALKK